MHKKRRAVIAVSLCVGSWRRMTVRGGKSGAQTGAKECATAMPAAKPRHRAAQGLAAASAPSVNISVPGPAAPPGSSTKERRSQFAMPQAGRGCVWAPQISLTGQHWGGGSSPSVVCWPSHSSTTAQYRSVRLAPLLLHLPLAQVVLQRVGHQLAHRLRQRLAVVPAGRAARGRRVCGCVRGEGLKL